MQEEEDDFQTEHLQFSEQWSPLKDCGCIGEIGLLHIGEKSGPNGASVALILADLFDLGISKKPSHVISDHIKMRCVLHGQGKW